MKFENDFADINPDVVKSTYCPFVIFGCPFKCCNQTELQQHLVDKIGIASHLSFVLDVMQRHEVLVKQYLDRFGDMYENEDETDILGRRQFVRKVSILDYWHSVKGTKVPFKPSSRKLTFNQLLYRNNL